MFDTITLSAREVARKVQPPAQLALAAKRRNRTAQLESENPALRCSVVKLGLSNVRARCRR
jgi:hypothetical protein